MLVREYRLFTKPLTNADNPYTVRKNSGAAAVSVMCTSLIPITICGSGKFQGDNSTPVSIAQDKGFTITEANSVESWEIAIPAGATAILSVLY